MLECGSMLLSIKIFLAHDLRCYKQEGVLDVNQRNDELNQDVCLSVTLSITLKWRSDRLTDKQMEHVTSQGFLACYFS